MRADGSSGERSERIRRAAEALARAKAAARARGERPPAGPLARAGSAAREPGGGEGLPSPPRSARGPDARPGDQGPARPLRPRRDDPQPLGAAISGLLGDQGWRLAAAVGSVFGRWDQIVGPELAAHTRPEAFADGELVVVADSTAWATQLRLLAAALVRRLNEELGNGAVQRVAVRGPAPPPRDGPWRVRGGRGPRGDYG